MFVLGISCYYHDAAACLINNGIVVAAAEEERFSRIKHDSRFPSNAIEFCLDFCKISIHDLDYVVFYEKPGLKLDRVLTTICKRFPHSKELFAEVLRNWGREKLWISETVRTRLGIPKHKILFSEHHLSHAASSFYCSPFTESSVLTVDGVGEWVTTTMTSACGTSFTRHAETLFPHSLGLLYSAFTEFLGFEVNEGEFKVMGMSPYGEARYKDKVHRLFSSLTPTSFELNMDYFAYETSLKSSYTKKFVNLWGEPRKREEPFVISKYAAEIGVAVEGVSPEVYKRSQYYADVAASIQSVVEDIMLNFAEGLRRISSTENLCITGGVAYNSVANGRILRESKFKNIYIQPAAGDSGAAIGAALAVYHVVHDRTSPKIMSHAYLGKEYSDTEIKETFDKNGYIPTHIDDENELIRHVAVLLSEGKVVGWFQGRFEFGPRALGNRSILADPRSLDMKHRVNSKIKFRESFRPFAPACLKSHAKIYYNLSDEDLEQFPYEFMLATTQARQEYRHQLEAVTHVNNSARIQIVPPTANPKYYKLIEAFGDITGIYILLNTSFNRRGEPIVASPQDALTTFEWSGIDVLVMGNFIVAR